MYTFKIKDNRNTVLSIIKKATKHEEHGNRKQHTANSHAKETRTTRQKTLGKSQNCRDDRGKTRCTRQKTTNGNVK